MSRKEAVLYMPDLGHSMGQHHNHRTVDDVTLASRYIADDYCNYLLKCTVSNRYGFMAFRTNSANRGESSAALLPFGDVPDIKALRSTVDVMEASDNREGEDLLTYLDEGFQMMETFIGKYKFGRKLHLITNGTCKSDWDPNVAMKLINYISRNRAKLEIILIDGELNEEESRMAGYSDGEIERRQDNIINLENLKSRVSSPSLINIRSFAEVADEIVAQKVEYPNPTASKTPTAVFLGVGDGDDSLRFNVHQYPAVRKPATAKSASLAYKTNQDKIVTPERETQYILPKPDYDSEDSDDDDDDIYNDPDCPTVDKDHLKKGYKFGNQLIEEMDPTAVSDDILEDPKIDICGFIEKQEVKPWLVISKDTNNYLVADTIEDQLKITALCLAMNQYQFYAVVRKVGASSTSVNYRSQQMGLLIPYGETSADGTDKRIGFVYCRMPYKEDVRFHQFPSLTNPKTVSGQPLTPNHEEYDRFVPTDKMTDLMEKVIESSMLASEDPGEGEIDPEDENYDPLANLMNPLQNQGILIPRKIHNPVKARYRQVIKHCAMQDDTQNLPEVNPMHIKYSGYLEDEFPNPDVREILHDLRDLFNIKQRKKAEKRDEPDSTKTKKAAPTNEEAESMFFGQDDDEDGPTHIKKEPPTEDAATAQVSTAQKAQRQTSKEGDEDIVIGIDNAQEDFIRKLNAVDEVDGTPETLVKTCVEYLKCVLEKAVDAEYIMPLRDFKEYIRIYKQQARAHQVDDFGGLINARAKLVNLEDRFKRGMDRVMKDESI